MGRGRIIWAVVVLSIGLTVAAQPVAASDDDWEDSCGDARIVSPTGEYSGSIDSPDDSDHIKFRLDKGEYITVTLLRPEEEKNMMVRERGDDGSFKDVGNARNLGGALVLPEGVPQVSFKYYPEEDGVHCLRLHESDEDEAEIPYEWRIKVRHQDPDPATFEGTGSEERISELESQLEQKNQRIQELEQEVENLSAQLDESSEGVSIDVQVEPASNGAYRVGDLVRVTADGPTEAVSEMTVSKNGETALLGTDGEHVLSLTEPGETELTFGYNDVTESITLDVQPREDTSAETTNENQQDTTTNDGADDSTTTASQEDSQDDSNQEPTETESDGEGMTDSETDAEQSGGTGEQAQTETETPGFDVLVALIGVLLAIGIANKYRGE